MLKLVRLCGGVRVRCREQAAQAGLEEFLRRVDTYRPDVPSIGGEHNFPHTPSAGQHTVQITVQKGLNASLAPPEKKRKPDGDSQSAAVQLRESGQHPFRMLDGYAPLNEAADPARAKVPDVPRCLWHTGQNPRGSRPPGRPPALAARIVPPR